MDESTSSPERLVPIVDRHAGYIGYAFTTSVEVSVDSEADGLDATTDQSNPKEGDE